MTQFHTILEQQLENIDASDVRQREAVYAQARAALDKTVAGDPERSDLANYLADLEQAIADVEGSYANAGGPPADGDDEPAPRPGRFGVIAASLVILIAVAAAGLWWFGALPTLQRAGGPGAVKHAEMPRSGDPRKDLAALGFADPEQAWNAAFRDGDVRLLNLAIDAGYRLDTTLFADAYLTLMMQPSKGLADPEFRNALHRLKTDISAGICASITAANIVPVRDMIEQIGIADYRFYCGTSAPAFKTLRSDLSAQWQSACRSMVPLEEIAQKKALDRDCAYDGFNGADKINRESLTTTETFKRLARIRDAIVVMEKLFQP